MAISNFSLLAVVLLSVLIVPVGCSRQGNMSDSDHVSIDMDQWIKDLDAAWASHEMEKILPFFTEECIYEDVASGEVFHGEEELRGMIKGYFEAFPDLRTETKCFSSGNKVCMEWIMTGTHSGRFGDFEPTGRNFSIRGVSLSELENGKIKRNADYYDSASLMRQLGLLDDAMISDQFVGTWKLNVAKSKASLPGLIHKSETIKIVAQESGSVYTFDGVDAAGKNFHGTWSGKYDGKYYPFIGNPDADMKSAKKTDPSTLVFVYSKDGKEVANWSFAISEDGKTITAIGKGKDSQGQEFRKDLVFDKQ